MEGLNSLEHSTPSYSPPSSLPLLWYSYTKSGKLLVRTKGAFVRPPRVNFTNILQAPFLNESFVQSFCADILGLNFFWRKNNGPNALIKCWWNWPLVVFLWRNFFTLSLKKSPLKCKFVFYLIMGLCFEVALCLQRFKRIDQCDLKSKVIYC